MKPKVIGTDGIPVKKIQKSQIIACDHESERPISVGGEVRRESSLDGFYEKLGTEKALKIQLAAMEYGRHLRNRLVRTCRNRQFCTTSFT